jgi:thiamine biosynthesis lipoprotein
LENKLGKYLTIIFAIALAALAVSRLGGLRKGPPTTAHRSRIMMDTVVSIRIYAGEDSTRSEEIVAAAFSEIARLEGLLSGWVSGSDVDRINEAAGGRSVSVSPEMWQVVIAAQEMSRLTEGAFDISIGAIMRLWDFQSAQALVPEESAIHRELRLVGSQQVLLDSVNIRVGLRERGAAIDLGGAAKGYAVDRAMEVLKDWGVKEALVDAGGDIGLLGRKSGDKHWQIGIRHPRVPGHIIEVLEVDSGAVATSGDYQRFFQQDGVRYHHILDPKTGMPARGAVSVTILAKTALEADIVSTAAFVLGPQRGMTLIEQLGEVEGIIYIEGPEASTQRYSVTKTHLPARRSS